MSENRRLVFKPASPPCLSTGELKDGMADLPSTGAKRLTPHSLSLLHRYNQEEALQALQPSAGC